MRNCGKLRKKRNKKFVIFSLTHTFKCCWINELLIMSQCLLKMLPIQPQHKLEITCAQYLIKAIAFPVFLRELSHQFHSSIAF